MDDLKDMYAQYDVLWAELLDTPAEDRRAAAKNLWAGDGPVEQLQKQMNDLREKMKPLERNFEEDLETALGEKIRTDPRTAVTAYGALCNTEWEHENGTRYGCSWRYAGGLIAEMRNENEDYMDFYCSGGEGTVQPEISGALLPLGWHVRETNPA